MGDAGGGADWPMQYAMLNHGQPGTGLLVPPFAQKKVAATMPGIQLAREQGPVFVSGVIDEAGKLQSLRTIRAQDARSHSRPAAMAIPARAARWKTRGQQSSDRRNLPGRGVTKQMMISAKSGTIAQRGFPQFFVAGKQLDLLPVDRCLRLPQQHGLHIAFLLAAFLLVVFPVASSLHAALYARPFSADTFLTTFSHNSFFTQLLRRNFQ